MKLFVQIHFFLLLLLSVSVTISAQPGNADSLEKATARMKDDTAKVRSLNDLVSKLEFSDPARAARIVSTAIPLAEKLNYTLGLATAYRLRGVLYIDKALLDSGKLYYDKAYHLVKTGKDRLYRRQVGLLMHNYGVIYTYKETFDSAISMYLEASGIYREINEETLLFYPYNNLSYIYSYLGDNNKALQYALEARAAASRLNNPNLLANAVNQEIGARMELKQYDLLVKPLRENLARAEGLKNHYLEGKSHNFMGQYFVFATRQFDSAIFHYKKALEVMKTLDNRIEIADITQNIGNAYVKMGDYREAADWLKRALTLGKTLELDQVQKYALENLITTEEKQGRFREALAYSEDLLRIKDSVQARSNRKQVNELEARYQNEKKEAQIKELKNEQEIQSLTIRQKNAFNYYLSGTAVVLLLVILLSYLNYRQKRRLQQQKINELETEKLLTATEAVLKGEEQERSRLAKDLHDGLSGMLSGTKYSLQTIKGNLVMTPDNHQAFERSIDMLDSSIREMRRVAQNMMPEALIRFGIDVAVRDYCTEINKSGILTAVYQSMNMEETQVEQTKAIVIFRILQELINNVIKHAAASQVLVQLFREEDKLLVNVEDNGRGFDTSAMAGGAGMGWNNIRSRVAYLKGKVDIMSEPGKGTAVNIELNLKA